MIFPGLEKKSNSQELAPFHLNLQTYTVVHNMSGSCECA